MSATKSVNDIQTRFAQNVEFKRSVDEESGVVTIEGIASKVGEYDMGWYVERIMPGAYDDILGDDIRILKNHDKNLLLGRTTSGTAEVFLTIEGHLGFRYTSPNRSFARDLEDEIATGDMSQCSVSFLVKESKWIESQSDDEKDVWEIHKMERCRDVGPVTFPANPDTSVAKRSQQEFERSKEAEKAKAKNNKPKNRSLTGFMVKRAALSAK